MKDLIRLTDLGPNDIYGIFHIADEISAGKYRDFLKGKSVVLFFPTSGVRTRVTFEKGIDLLGGQPILFPSETLDKREELQDVFGYLDNWADTVIIRHKDIKLLEAAARYAKVPVINAMTDQNHPCEILSDLYALSKMRDDFLADHYLFVGKKGNIGLAWKEAAKVLGFSISQCCGAGYEMDGVEVYHEIDTAVQGKDIICTDSLSAKELEDFKDCQVTKAVMEKANQNAVLNPCPPFYRGEEVSADAIASNYFVGYGFKKSLLEIQQAVMVWCRQGY